MQRIVRLFRERKEEMAVELCESEKEITCCIRKEELD